MANDADDFGAQQRRVRYDTDLCSTLRGVAIAAWPRAASETEASRIVAAMRITASLVRAIGTSAVSQHLKPAWIVAAVVRPHRQFEMPLEIDGPTPRLHRILVPAAPYGAVELHQVASRLAVLGELQQVEAEVFDTDMTVLAECLRRAQWRVATGRVARLLIRRRHQFGDAVIALIHLGDPALARLDVAFEVLPFDRSTEQLGRILEPTGSPIVPVLLSTR